jgi:two-component system cell cycle sensor histidine kinase PleC
MAMNHSSRPLDAEELALTRVQTARANVQGTLSLSLVLLTAMVIICWWGFRAGVHYVPGAVLIAGIAHVACRMYIRRRAKATTRDADWLRLYDYLRGTAAISMLMWVATTLAIFPVLQPLQSVAYLFALSLAFTSTAIHFMGSPWLVAGFVGGQLAAVMLAVPGNLAAEIPALLLLLICWFLWYRIMSTGVERTMSLASQLFRAKTARRLRAERAERRVRAAELRAADARTKAAESRTLFVARASHELRTPLQTIVAGLEVLQSFSNRDTSADPKIRALLGRLAQSAEQVLALSHDLSDFIRWESGAHPVKMSDVAVPELMDDVAANLAERARLRGVRLNVQHEGAPATNETDASRLRAITTNLLVNAIKYAPAGSVLLSTRRSADGALDIQVSDNGPGLPASVVKVLGTPWVRGDDVRVQEEGFGLGLSIVMSLAQDIGAKVTVDTGSHGTTFNISLPGSKELAA